MMTFFGSSPSRRARVYYRARSAPRLSLPPPRSPGPLSRRNSENDALAILESPSCRQTFLRAPSDSPVTSPAPVANQDKSAAVYGPITPPSSSQPQEQNLPCPSQIQPSYAPERIARYTPETFDETIARITAFLNPNDTAHLEMEMLLNDEIYLDFLCARDSASHGDPLFRLRYTFHSSTSTLITRCSPTPVHDSFQSFFISAEKSFCRRLDLSEDEQPWELISPEIGGFSGDAAGSRKQADMCIMPTADDGTVLNDGFPLVATEVGFSESYANLLRDMRLWLIGSKGKVRAVILVAITETPKYASKPILESDPALEIPAALGGHPFGPRMHGAHVLVGAITAVLEIWRYKSDGDTVEREVRVDVVPADPGHTHFHLSMLDFYGRAERVPERFEPEDKVPFALEAYRRKISDSIARLGLQRMQKIESETRKRAVKVETDGDWEPERNTKRVRR